jgi:hypothetical protein
VSRGLFLFEVMASGIHDALDSAKLLASTALAFPMAVIGLRVLSRASIGWSQHFG